MTINLDQFKTVWKDDVQALADLPSIDALVRQTKRRNRMTWLAVALELLMLCGVLVIMIYLIITSAGWLASIMLGVFALVLIGVQIWMLRARDGLWRVAATEPIQHAIFCVAQAELNLKFAKFSKIAGPAGLLMGYAAMKLSSREVSTDLLELGIAILAVIGWLIFCRYWIRLREAQLQAARNIEQELR